MIKLYRKYRTIKKLKHTLNNFDDYAVPIESEPWLKRVKKDVLGYFDNDQKIRQLVAKILVKWRNKHPYKPQYRESKKLYEEYFQMENHIPSFKVLREGDYVVKFRSQAPVKGDRYAEYHTNDGFPVRLGTYKLGKKNEEYGYFHVDHDVYGEGVSENFLTSFRYATEEEKKEYDANTERYEKLGQLIDEGFKAVGRLQKEQQNIFKS